MDNVVNVMGAKKRFGQVMALSGANFSVPEGSVTTLLGANGAGKSTVMKMMVNLLRPTDGVVTVFDKTSTTLKPLELQKIGYVAEGMELPDWMTVAQYLNWCRPLYPSWDGELEQTLGELFKLPLDRKLSALSRGQRMKAALWAVLSYRPELLILDEPFSGLDPLVRDDLVKSVLELAGNQRWAVLISTHDISEVENLADRVVVMRLGKVEIEADREELLERWRRVEVLVPAGWEKPERYPREWLSISHSGKVVSFYESEYGENFSEKITSYFGETKPELHRVSLRDLLVTLAKAGHVEVGA